MMKPFEQALLNGWPLEKWKNHRSCLAVSGGADSTALLIALANITSRTQIEKSLVVAHVHHGLRKTEADEDAAFVEALAKRLGIRYRQSVIDQDYLREEVKKEGSWESAARNLRYQLLLETAQREGARYLLTAHTKNDLLETILHRIFRGTGITGLMAIPPIRPLNDAVVLVRPLLDIQREEVIDYLQRQRQNWRTDSSNFSADYQRNRIRHELVPVLNSLFPHQWEQSLSRLTSMAREVSGFTTDSLERFSMKVHPTPYHKGIRLPRLPFLEIHPYLTGEYLRKIGRLAGWSERELGQSQWNRMTAMVYSEKKEICEFPGGITVETNEESILIYPTKNLVK